MYPPRLTTYTVLRNVHSTLVKKGISLSRINLLLNLYSIQYISISVTLLNNTTIDGIKEVSQ